MSCVYGSRDYEQFMFYCGLLGSTCLIQSLGLRGGTGYIFLFVWILMNEPGIRICSLASKTRAFRFVSSPFLPARTIISARLNGLCDTFEQKVCNRLDYPKRLTIRHLFAALTFFPRFYSFIQWSHKVKIHSAEKKEVRDKGAVTGTIPK